MYKKITFFIFFFSDVFSIIPEKLNEKKHIDIPNKKQLLRSTKNKNIINVIAGCTTILFIVGIGITSLIGRKSSNLKKSPLPTQDINRESNPQNPVPDKSTENKEDLASKNLLEEKKPKNLESLKELKKITSEDINNANKKRTIICEKIEELFSKGLVEKFGKIADGSGENKREKLEVAFLYKHLIIRIMKKSAKPEDALINDEILNNCSNFGNQQSYDKTLELIKERKDKRREKLLLVKGGEKLDTLSSEKKEIEEKLLKILPEIKKYTEDVKEYQKDYNNSSSFGKIKDPASNNHLAILNNAKELLKKNQIEEKELKEKKTNLEKEIAPIKKDWEKIKEDKDYLTEQKDLQDKIKQKIIFLIDKFIKQQETLIQKLTDPL